MADDITPKAGAPDVRPEDIAKNNADVKAKLEGQDINGKPNAPEDDVFGNTGDALDKLRETVTKQDDDAPPAADTIKPAAKPDVQPKDDDQTPPDDAAKKAAEEKAAAEAAAKPAAEGDDVFKDIQLPPGARPKSGEAFGLLKAKAQQEIEAREKEIARLKSEVEARDAKLKDPVPAELQSELKELREFRAKFDIDADPKFKEFDKTVTTSRDFIYAQLLKNPNITQEVVDSIKKYGGPENVKMEKIYEAMQDPTAQRLIESSIAEIERAKFNQEQARALAKKNVSSYIEEREKQMEAAKTGHNESTRAELTKLREQLPWMNKVTPDPKATDEQKKAAEAHNAFVEDISKQLDAALQDDSPHMRAIMLAGMAQLFWVRDRYAALKAHSDSLEKTVTELNEKLGKFKGAAVSRLDKSAAAKDAAPPKMDKDTDIFSQRAGDSLDNIRSRIIEEKSRANAS